MYFKPLFYIISFIFLSIQPSSYSSPGKDSPEEPNEKRKIENTENRKIKKTRKEKVSVFTSTPRGVTTQISSDSTPVILSLPTPEPATTPIQQMSESLNTIVKTHLHEVKPLKKSFIESIPMDIISLIFEYLPTHASFNFSQTSKRFRGTLKFLKKAHLTKYLGCAERLEFLANHCPNLSHLKLELSQLPSGYKIINGYLIDTDRDPFFDVKSLKDSIFMRFILLMQNGAFANLTDFECIGLDLDHLELELITSMLGKYLKNNLNSLNLKLDCSTVKANRLDVLFDEIKRYPSLQHLKSFSFIKSILIDNEALALSRAFSMNLLADLTKLDLSYNYFTIEKMKHLASGLQTGQHAISHLHLRNCEIDDNIVMILCQPMQEGALTALSHLDLGFNKLTYRFIEFFSTILTSNRIPNLKSLMINENSFWDNSIIKLIDALMISGIFLNEIYFNSTLLTEESFNYFFNYLKTKTDGKVDRINSNILFLQKYFVNFPGNIFSEFNFINLTELKIYNSIGVKQCNEDDIKTLFQTLSQISYPNLKTIKLGLGGQFNSASVHFIDFIQKNCLSNITELDLSHNFIRVNTMKKLASAFKKANFNNIKIFSLKCNGISNSGFLFFISVFKSGKFNSLISLDISGNNFKDDSFVALANVIMGNQLPNLEELFLDLDNSHIEGVSAFEQCLLKGKLERLKKLPKPIQKDIDL